MSTPIMTTDTQIERKLPRRLEKSRKEALHNNLIKYHTEIPCTKGHTLCYTSNTQCVECAQLTYQLNKDERTRKSLEYNKKMAQLPHKVAYRNSYQRYWAKLKYWKSKIQNEFTSKKIEQIELEWKQKTP